MNDLKFAFRRLLRNPGFTAVPCSRSRPSRTSASVEDGKESMASPFPLHANGTDKPFTKTKMSFNGVGRQNRGCEQGSRNQRGERGHEKQMETGSKSSSKWILAEEWEHFELLLAG